MSNPRLVNYANLVTGNGNMQSEKRLSTDVANIQSVRMSCQGSDCDLGNTNN